MLEYDRIDISEGIGINKTNVSKECDICYYSYFLDKNFKYEQYLCDVCYDFWDMSKNDVCVCVCV